jgi:NB-ARC domain
MADLLIEQLCQRLAAKLQAAPTAGMNDLIVYLKNVIESDLTLKTALNQKAVQINQGDARGYQVLVEGGQAYIGEHLHVNDPGIVEAALNTILTAYLSKPVGIPNNLNRCYSGTPDFVGRELDWEWLCSQMQQPTQNGQPVIVSLAGMGGVGKTELAIQYARQHLNRYQGGICWIFAGEFEVGPQIVSFAITQFNLQIPEGFDLSEQLDFCWRRWSEGEVLLVLDDVADFAKIQSCLPPDPRFKVLMTTRRAMGSPVRSRSLEVLTPKASLELLGSEALVGESRLELEQPIAERLCEWLGYLPLGLELVGRYLHQEPDLPLSTMLFNLQHQALKEESLVRDPGDENWSLTAQRGVAAAFELSWAKLKEDPRRLGRLLGLFALAPIPWELVESAEQYLSDLFPQNGAFDPENLSKARRELIGLHLLSRVEPSVYLLHALIRKFFQQKLEEIDRATD